MIPERIGLLGERLLKLNLDGNMLKVIPASIGNLTRLSDLSIAKNKLETVEGDCLTNLSALVMLDLH